MPAKVLKGFRPPKKRRPVKSDVEKPKEEGSAAK